MKLLKKTKRLIALSLVFVIIIGSFAGCGKSKKSSKEESTYLTRAGWIKMLGESMELDTYNESTPYYSDVESDSEIFPYVQAAREWGIISEDEEFKPNDVATFGFVATTAVLASEGDYSKIEKESESEAIIEFAKTSGILSSDFSDSHLNDAVSIEEAEMTLENAKIVFLTNEKTPVENIKLSEDVKDFRDNKTEVVSIDETQYKISYDVANDFEIGTVFIAPGDAESPAGIARKVESVSDNGDGTYTLVTIQPELEEVYQELEYYGTITPTIDNITAAEGVEVSCEDVNNKQYASYINSEDSTAIFIDTLVDDSAEKTGDKKTTSKFTFEVNFTKGTVSFDDGFLKKELDLFADNIAYKSGTSKDELGEWFKKTGVIPSAQAKKAEKELEDNMNLYKEGEITKGELYERCNLNKDGTEKVGATNVFKGGYEIKGKIVLEDFYVTPDISLKKRFGIPYGIDSLSVAVGNKTSMELSVKGTLSEELTVAKVSIPVGTTGVTVDVKVKLAATLDGSITVKYEVENSQKFTYDDGKFKATNTKKSTVSGEIMVEFTAGPELEVSISFLKIGIADVSVNCNFKAKASAVLSTSTEVTEDPSANTITVTYTGKLTPEVVMYFPIIELKVGYSKDTLMGKLKLSHKWTLVDEKEGWTKVFADDNDEIIVYTYQETEPIVEETTAAPTTEATTESTTKATTESTTKATSGGNSINLDISDYYVSVSSGDSKTITVVSIPNGYKTSDVTWSSDNSTVATVSGGNIKAVGEGICTITAKLPDGTKCECTVVVTK